MMKVFVLAVIGAACSSVAFAGEVKQPVVKATTMSDAQMDKVTAGDAGGQGKGEAFGLMGQPGWQFNEGKHAGPK